MLTKSFLKFCLREKGKKFKAKERKKKQKKNLNCRKYVRVLTTQI